MAENRYDVHLSCSFDAVSPEDAALQMVIFVIDNAAKAGYRVDEIAEDGSLLGTSFIDVENLIPELAGE